MKIEIKLTRIPLLVQQEEDPNVYRPSYISDETRMAVVNKGVAVLVLDVGDTDQDCAVLMDQADGFLRRALRQAVPEWERKMLDMAKKIESLEGNNKALEESNLDLDRRLEIVNRLRHRLRNHLQIIRQKLGLFQFGSRADNDQIRRLMKLDPEAD